MMVNVSLVEYWYKWLPETASWEEFQKYWPLATMDERPKDAYSIKGPVMIPYEDAAILADMGVRLEISPLPGAMVCKIKDQHLHMWEWGEKAGGKELAKGSAIQIAVPDMAMMYIDEVEVLEDCCTDNLQGYLNEGWRLLAVCPPNAQQRPDYVVGRRKKKDPFE